MSENPPTPSLVSPRRGVRVWSSLHGGRELEVGPSQLGAGLVCVYLSRGVVTLGGVVLAEADARALAHHILELLGEQSAPDADRSADQCFSTHGPEPDPEAARRAEASRQLEALAGVRDVAVGFRLDVLEAHAIRLRAGLEAARDALREQGEALASQDRQLSRHAEALGAQGMRLARLEPDGGPVRVSPLSETPPDTGTGRPPPIVPGSTCAAGEGER